MAKKAAAKSGDNVIGVGRLSWGAGERRTDRYGAVVLMVDGDSAAQPSAYVAPKLDGRDGQHGTLFAEVIETRESTHIGDLFRGFGPETPEVGELIELGTGHLFSEPAWSEGGKTVVGVGVKPTDGRAADWMDPKALYRAHWQTVRLFFV